MRTFPAILASGLLVASLTSCSSDNGDDNTPKAQRSATSAALAPTLAKLTLSATTEASGPQITVAIEAPSGARDMQVGLDPNFGDDEWQPVAPSVVLDAFEGYQEVFARFRGEDGQPSEFSVVGIMIDSMAAGATADPPVPSLAGLITPQLLEVTLEVGRITRGVGQRGDTYSGVQLDGADLEDEWTLKGPAAPSVKVLRRVSVPTDGGRDSNGEMTSFAMRHTVTLQLSAPLTPNGIYTLRAPNGSTVDLTADAASISPAVHVNQVGYGSNDAKVAYYSLSDALGAAAKVGDVGFSVVDGAGTVVLQGTGQLRGATDEAGKGDVTQATVFRLDFSDVRVPGRYRICIDDVGCSTSVEINDTVWSSLATTVARSLYYNRSGIELNAPYASFVRPRPDHPDDATVVYETGLTAFEASEQTDETVFDSITEQATTTPVANAWGGHFDAGDWDRRPQHLFMARQLLDIARRYPEAFGDGGLNLPESGNGIDDLVDEALWTLDLFERMQLDDGAIRGGIESERFPDWGTASWQDTITRYAYAPDAWSSWIYASVAADAALALAGIDDERSNRYEASALNAWRWAETQPVPKTEDPTNAKVLSQRATAAAALYELTEDPAFAAAFVEDNPFLDGPSGPLACHANEWCDALWRYLTIPEALTDAQLRASFEESFVTLADSIVDASESTKFGWCLEDPGVPMVWGMGVGGNPHLITVLRAALLNDDRELVAAAQRCAAISLGANPTNTSFVTGRGDFPVRHPLIVDASFGGLPVWAGIPVYGTHPLEDLSWVEEYRLAPAGANVDSADLPLLESWFDLPDVAAMNEFTVFQSQAPVVWATTALSELQRSAG